MLNAAYGMLAILPVAFWTAGVRGGVTTTQSRLRQTTESVRSTIDADAQVRGAANGELAAIIERFRVRRAQRHREQRELKAWLEITREPLW